MIEKRLSRDLLLLCVFCAFSFGAIVHVALATSYHTTCVGHGFVSGSSQTDGSFFSRVEVGCGSTYRRCQIYTGGTHMATEVAYDSTTCNLWSNSIGSLSECNSSAHVYNQGVFSDHFHLAPNWCG